MPIDLSFSTWAATALTETIALGTDVTGVSLTIEFSDRSDFATIRASKTVTGAGKNATFSLTATEVDSLKGGRYRIKAGSVIYAFGAVHYVAAAKAIATSVATVDPTSGGTVDPAVLAAKADLTYVDAALSAKPDASALAAKADKTYVDTALSTKADTSALAAKADTSALATKADASVLATKADKSYVDNALAAKADTSALAAKADTSAVSAKADKTYVDNALSAKADTSAVSAKADKTYVDSALAAKADASAVSAKADKTYVDSGFAPLVSGKVLDANLPDRLSDASLKALVDAEIAALHLTSAPATPTIYAQDSFNRADSTTLGSTEVGNFTWQATSAGTFSISGGKLAWNGTGDKGCMVNTGISDKYEIEVVAGAQAGTYPVLIAFGSSTTFSSGYNWIYRTQTANTWTLSESGGANQVVGGGTNIATGDTITVRKVGQAITLFHNGAQQAAWTTTSHVGAQDTYQGVMCANTFSGSIDNFIVRQVL